ncbi:MAG TPA: isoprenylcysteine carboxyl methyltransferase, partial [Firmicutes bacterium]|nr:isoprenylcysteine carboxyl methyltransferase [Bacillota bacterium]
RNPAFLGFYLTYIGILLTFSNWVLLVFTIFTT